MWDATEQRFCIRFAKFAGGKYKSLLRLKKKQKKKEIKKYTSYFESHWSSERVKQFIMPNNLLTVFHCILSSLP